MRLTNSKRSFGGEAEHGRCKALNPYSHGALNHMADSPTTLISPYPTVKGLLADTADGRRRIEKECDIIIGDE
jgi:hypothetical protein